MDTLATVWRSAASGFVNKIGALTDCIQAYDGAGSKASSSRSAVQKPGFAYTVFFFFK